MEKRQWKNEVKKQLELLKESFNNLTILFEDSEEMGEFETIGENFPFEKSFEEIDSLVTWWVDNLAEKLSK